MKKNYLISQARTRIFGLLSLIFVVNFSYSQNNYTIHFQEETIVFPENIHTFHWDQMPEHTYFDNGYFGWIQFYETPNQTVQDRFKNANLKLLEYIPHRTYLFYFPANTSVDFLKNNGVRGIIPLEAEFKISKELNYPPFEWWAMDGNNIKVTLQFHHNASLDFVKNELAKLQIKIIEEYRNADVIDISIPDNCLVELANLPFVKWIELIVAPDEPEDTRGRSLHRSNSLDPQSNVNTNYTGVGVGVLVRDDGIVGPHIDFQGRIDNTFASGTGQTHGDGVAGILAGAGNLNPTMRGMAAGSSVYVVNYAANFLDGATQNYINNDIVQITNSSYGNGCNAGYTTTARNVDLQANNISALMHVFSCGNSGTTNCGYGAGNQWGNITGGHKQGKNVIATANVFFDGSLVNSSSKGPAHDGRIKPDITANGQNQNSTSENNQYLVFGGTSGASPGIAGVSAQLYELYASQNNGDHPPAALIKATLLNTATDYGNVGPDFKFGWGIVNGRRAGKLIEEERYLSSQVSQGVTNNHTINVPTGTSQVRFMLYWNDPAAAGASPALVNDLDLVVKNPSNTSFLPWILDSTPNATALNTPATNGIDRLNNMEQVLLNNPTAGNYTIEVTGFNVPFGPQEYFIVYEIITQQLVVTYPNGEESFVPGVQEAIHWDAYNTTADFLIEYTNNNGSTWTPISTVNSNLRLFSWTPPAQISGQARIRVTSGAHQDESDANFSIASQVTGLQLTMFCPEEATFTWNNLSGANAYDLYLLGDMYMEVAGSTSTTTITVPVTNGDNGIWYAIVAKNSTLNWESRRTVAQFHNGALLNCVFSNDLAITAINNDPSDFIFFCNDDAITVSVSLLNLGSISQSNFTMRYQIDNQPAVEETFTSTINSGQQVNFNFATQIESLDDGAFTLSTEVILASDQNSSNNSLELDFYSLSSATSLDYYQDFETGFPPNGWVIFNPDNQTTWTEASSILGSGGSFTRTSFMNNFVYQAQGQLDTFQTEIFDLNDATSATLTFDLAKAQFSAQMSDGLRVEISIDCSNTFTTIYQKSGTELATISNYVTTNWSPNSPNNWRNEQIDLSNFLGEYIILRFVNINGYGNSTFIDNINIEGALSNVSFQAGEFVMFPNPASNEVFIQFYNNSSNNAEIKINNALGQMIFNTNTLLNAENRATVNTSGFASGMYFVTIKNGDQTQIKKLIIK